MTGIKNKILVAALLTPMAVSQVAVGAVGNAIAKEHHKEWRSFVLTTDSAPIYRAITNNSDSALSININSGCTEYTVSIAELLDDEPTETEHVDANSVTSRIDTNDPHYGEGNLAVYKNEPTIYFHFYPINKDRFLWETMSGNTIRFKFSNDLYKRYSLSGSKAAIQRAAELCNRGVVDRDSGYFM